MHRNASVLMINCMPAFVSVWGGVGLGGRYICIRYVCSCVVVFVDRIICITYMCGVF